jgi:hypothetical protein
MTESYTMVFSVDARLVEMYRASAWVLGLLPAYVWWKTHRDAACSRNSPMVRRIRGWGLLATGSILIVSSVCFSIEILIFVIFLGAVNFVINAYALWQRAHYPNDRTPVHAIGGRRIAFRPLVLVSALWHRRSG